VLVIAEEGKPVNRERTLRARREPAADSTHIWDGAGIELGPHWWEAPIVTTAASLFSVNRRSQRNDLA